VQTPTARVGTVAVAAAVLLLPACSAGISNAGADACNRMLSWHTGGQEPDRYDEAVAGAQDDLTGGADRPLADALTMLTGSPADERVARVEAFLAACLDQGWELPEG